jgi:hypothetical protein
MAGGAPGNQAGSAIPSDWARSRSSPSSGPSPTTKRRRGLLSGQAAKGQKRTALWHRNGTGFLAFSADDSGSGACVHMEVHMD